ncbi:MAG: secretin N-terminal domain-containing protein, partial [Gammaproteobacteria bacterium]
MSQSLHLLRWASAVLMAASLSACQSLPSGSNSAGKAIEQALQPPKPGHAAAAPQPPEAVQNALLPPVTVQAPHQTPPSQQRFNMSVNEVPAGQFFMGLVKGTPYNMVVHPDVKGKISLDLKNVTVDEVMNTVRDVYGYEFRREGNLFEVLPARLRSRIFHVNYLNIRRTGTSETRVSSGGISEGPSNNNNGNSTSNTPNPTGTTNTMDGGNTNDSSRQPQQLSGSAVTTQSNADFWSGLKTALKLLVGDKHGRSVVVDAQSGIIVVRAMPNELRDVADFLHATQSSVQRQVILEAKILEVDLNHGFQSGINWAALGQPGSGKSIVAGQVGGG